MPEQTPMVDPSNNLLAPQPAQLTMGRIRDNDGNEMAVMTIRTTSTTLTVILEAQDAKAWLGTFKETVEKLTGVSAAPAGLVIPRSESVPQSLRRRTR